MLPLLVLFAIRVDPADPDVVAALQDLARANAAAAAAAPPVAPPPAPPQRQRQRPALRGRPRWGESDRRDLPPPISSLRRRPVLVRNRTGDGRLVITHRGEGRGGLVCTRRRDGEGEDHLTMRLL